MRSSMSAARAGPRMRCSISVRNSTGSSELTCGLTIGMLMSFAGALKRERSGFARQTGFSSSPTRIGSTFSKVTSSRIQSSCWQLETTGSITSVSLLPARSSPSWKPIGTMPPKRSTPGMWKSGPWTTLMERRSWSFLRLPSLCFIVAAWQCIDAITARCGDEKITKRLSASTLTRVPPNDSISGMHIACICFVSMRKWQMPSSFVMRVKPDISLTSSVQLRT
mmetsp:Transcript_25627/g.56134  ORF Transcript_25627/g.56134 Transcript_25627/m.56134 type:complete len:223 (-) Transcript_25627:621-1289(-)